MKNTFLTLSLFSVLLGCNEQKPTHKEIVTSYFNAFNSRNYSQIKALVSDSLTITEGDFITTFDHDSYYEHFKWDSIFKPSYEILEIKEENNQVLATIASKSVRYEFLKNNPLTCKRRTSFTSGKISKIEILDCIDVDWTVWQKERDSLVAWTTSNHPELNGFINDLTMKGAQNYLKAMKLYGATKAQ
ncbi:hypothetical protein MTsPCn9_09760 [Croceitalea sp. MTPC9]|uniref:hypothetical protein n=1 Tax=unclassified Croceitalea TaxID=2632280 RepID=UPI002B38D182|nr:hypothetical protein MTsPCn6_27480 [Croceitalea sp. MTPC6]GMN16040.1 hypothetical protein MTsPCn9_09760 [Croceitalea sp. MTPC9]